LLFGRFTAPIGWKIPILLLAVEQCDEVTEIIAVDVAACEALFTEQAQTIGDSPIGRGQALPATVSTWENFYQTELPDDQEPWWAHRQKTGESFEGILWVAETLSYFEGHFRDNPILPGIVQIDWAVSAAQSVFSSTPEDAFYGMSRLKFRAPIRPGTWLKMSLQLDTENINFELRDAETIRTQGRLHYHV
jgi:hypothetical protein